jgi:hypothetical protein
MPFKLKEGAETDGLPTITLAGEKYFVARLPLRHRIAVSKLLPKALAVGVRLREAVGVAQDAAPDDVKRAIAAGRGASFEIAEEDYLAVVDIVSRGLLALYPGATREALLDEPIDTEELFAAWPIVVDQGASRRHAAGEALATSSSPASSGESSSPNSA